MKLVISASDDSFPRGNLSQAGIVLQEGLVLLSLCSFFSWQVRYFMLFVTNMNG